ncbi:MULTISPECIES: bifunctional 2-polyprenyl-6-hydroxyphenol methylase/3-demethylubiquinol 3-O-methyltransferase UbiG [Nostoc]|uniref:Class I SAM-dependent methyltransferase n=1 Tax=Nostoc paludosum FACHB-159 TaxID=2692908 RepID=A0ABR8KF99_9NOSO|nr:MULTISPECIES: class I SAM-dependent methyltransferase [Nostoc]MBD2681045.1 class I SAM-dependent methyltransferase [Nostoc sp. FACHB-857]MBD2737519.1 class I SAM-dependent methyltransferase [Nostoc paludosum FACHB-159]
MSKNSIDNRKKLVALRHTNFQKNLSLNHQLIDLVRDIDSHAFLTNPASQNIFLYLTEYVRAVLEYWFGTSLDKVRVLDWGCGKGHISFLMREMGVQITSCDVGGGGDSAFNQITPIIEKAPLKVVPLEHLYLLPFSDASFDVVLSFGVLEHVPNDLASLGEIHRVLKPSGLFFCFFLPYYLSWTQNLAHLRGDFYHDRLYSQKMVKNLLKQTNFELLDFWHRQLLPKNSVSYPKYHVFESVDQWLTTNTPLKYTATNIEFVAVKS